MHLEVPTKEDAFSRSDSDTLPEHEVHAIAAKAQSALANAFPESLSRIEDMALVGASNSPTGPLPEASPIRARLDLPPDQKMYLSIARFIQTSLRLGNQQFRLDAHRGTMRVDLLAPTSQLVLRSASYSYATSDDGEIASLEDAISKDFSSTPALP